MKEKREYQIWVILSISCLFVFLPFAGYGAELIIGNDVTVNGDLSVNPGRTPWNTRSQILPNAGGCFSAEDCYDYAEGTTYATFNLRPVPAGKRWVVQSATGGMVNGNGRTNNIELTNIRGGIIFDGEKWAFGGPFMPGTSFSSVIFNANLFAIFDPGETPTVRVTATPSLSGYTVIVFSGYLIDAN